MTSGAPFPVPSGIASGSSSSTAAPSGAGVLLGDSHQANAGYDTSAESSSAQLVRARGAVTWALATLNGRGYVKHNAGIPGQRTDQILARFGTDVAPYSPGWVLVTAGINNVLQLVASPAAVAPTVAGAIADLTSLINRCQAIGAVPVLTTIPPMSTMTADQLNAWAQINRWIRSLARSSSSVRVVDWTRRVTAAPGVWPGALTYDGTHANAAGAARMALDLAPALDRILPTLDELPGYTDALDLISNGVMNGTAGSLGGGVTGQVADGWTVAADGGVTTTAASKVARTDGTNGAWQQLVVSAGNGVRCYQSLDAEWAVGDSIYCRWEFQSSGLTVASLTDMYATISTITSNQLAPSIKNAGGDSYNDPACALTAGVFVTAPVAIQAGTTDVRAEFHMLGATGTILLGRCSVFKVGLANG